MPRSARIAEHAAYVLVDEYQDTNAIQYEMLKLLAGRAPAVHRGRRRRPEHLRLGGATIDNLKRLPQDYPQLKVIALEQNTAPPATSCAPRTW